MRSKGPVASETAPYRSRDVREHLGALLKAHYELGFQGKAPVFAGARADH